MPAGQTVTQLATTQAHMEHVGIQKEVMAHPRKAIREK